MDMLAGLIIGYLIGSVFMWLILIARPPQPIAGYDDEGYEPAPLVEWLEGLDDRLEML